MKDDTPKADDLAAAFAHGAALVGLDALADAYRAGAEAMRDACIARIICGCPERDAVEAGVRAGIPPSRFCDLGTWCAALQAAELRAVSIPDPQVKGLRRDRDGGAER